MLVDITASIEVDVGAIATPVDVSVPIVTAADVEIESVVGVYA